MALFQALKTQTLSLIPERIPGPEPQTIMMELGPLLPTEMGNQYQNLATRPQTILPTELQPIDLGKVIALLVATPLDQTLQTLTVIPTRMAQVTCLLMGKVRDRMRSHLDQVPQTPSMTSQQPNPTLSQVTDLLEILTPTLELARAMPIQALRLRILVAQARMETNSQMQTRVTQMPQTSPNLHLIQDQLLRTQPHLTQLMRTVMRKETLQINPTPRDSQALQPSAHSSLLRMTPLQLALGVLFLLSVLLIPPHLMDLDLQPMPQSPMDSPKILRMVLEPLCPPTLQRQTTALVLRMICPAQVQQLKAFLLEQMETQASNLQIRELVNPRQIHLLSMASPPQPVNQTHQPLMAPAWGQDQMPMVDCQIRLLPHAKVIVPAALVNQTPQNLMSLVLVKDLQDLQLVASLTTQVLHHLGMRIVMILTRQVRAKVMSEQEQTTRQTLKETLLHLNQMSLLNQSLRLLSSLLLYLKPSLLPHQHRHPQLNLRRNRLYSQR